MSKKNRVRKRKPLAVLNCDGCGACCDTQGTPPFSYQGGDRPPAHLMWDIEEHMYRYDDGEPCLWYDTQTKQCKHYEHRPDACREFPVGGEDCLRMRTERGIPEGPPAGPDEGPDKHQGTL